MHDWQSLIAHWEPLESMPDPGNPATWPDWYVWTGGWYETNGEEMQYDWPNLAPNSIVFEIGGYEGKWAAEIARRYDPHIHFFEPAPRAFNMARDKLGDNPKVQMFSAGLWYNNGTMMLGDSQRDGAAFDKKDSEVQVTVRDIAEVQGDIIVDLMQVNVEGAEFYLLPHLINTGLVNNIKHFQTQWHTDWFLQGLQYKSQEAMWLINSRLAETHEMIWNLGAFEAWRLKTLSI